MARYQNIKISIDDYKKVAIGAFNPDTKDPAYSIQNIMAGIKAFDLDTFLDNYFKNIFNEPWIFKVKYPENLRIGSEIKAFFSPFEEEQDLSKREKDRDIRAVYRLPRLILREKLTISNFRQFKSMIDVTIELLNLNCLGEAARVEALSFVLSWKLIEKEVFRKMWSIPQIIERGLPISIPPANSKLNRISGLPLMQKLDLEDQCFNPEFQIDDILNFWNILGQEYAIIFKKKLQSKRGIYLYSRFPSLFVKFDVIKKSYMNRKIQFKEPNVALPLRKAEIFDELSEIIGDQGDNVPVLLELYSEHQALESNCNNEFRKNGDYWSIKFNGQRLQPIKNLKGLRYIHLLISNPGKKINVIEMSNIINGNIDMAPSIDSYNDRIMDKRTITALKSKYDLLIKNINAAKSNNQTESVIDQQQEAQFIQNELNKCLNLRKSSRSFNSDKEKARKAVLYCISIAQNRIKGKNPDLWVHLKNSIHTGFICSYMPDSQISWNCY